MEQIKTKLNTYGDRIDKFLSNLLKTGKDKRTDSFLNARLQLLDKYWTTYLKLYDELCDSATPEELKEHEFFTTDIFSQIESAYIDTSCWLSGQLQPPRPSESSETSLNATVRGNSLVQAVKLPEIKLPSFNGSYLEWPAFRDTYLSLIHDNGSLSQVQKMYYLKSSLSGEASRLLQHLVLTEANYTAAWKILSDRYNNMRVLVNSNLNALVNLTAMASESASELRRVVDSFTQHVGALENLQRPIDKWNDWHVYFLSSKLEPSTRKDWEANLVSSTELPSFEDLTAFLERRIHTLDVIKGPTSRTASKSSAVPTNSKAATKSFYSTTSQHRCTVCQQRHFVLFCPQFRSKSVEDRIVMVQDKKLCSNCLRTQHTASNCKSDKRCKICQGNHHTMLHKTNSVSAQGNASALKTSSLFNNADTQLSISTPSTLPTTKSATSEYRSVSSHLVHSQQPAATILLATAIVLVRSAEGRLIKARALLDQGSKCNFITAALANLLRLPKDKVNIAVTGVGGNQAGVVRASVKHDIISTVNSSCYYTVQSLVMPTLTQQMPSKYITEGNWAHISGLVLADPEFTKPRNIDLILGVELYAQILQGELIRGEPRSPVAQATSLGWVLSGSIDQSCTETINITSLHSSTCDLDLLLKKFWETEEPPKLSLLTPQEEECEQFFADTHYRTANGRYVVRLPIKQEVSRLGQSKSFALTMLKRVERKCSTDQSLFASYSAFMQEYLSLGHMTPVEHNNCDATAYYLPHHAVVKPSSSTTKLRVVFNASQKTSSGLSLNDILHTGPKLQNDIITIILRWRFFPFIYAADIEKMFRQILVNEKNRDLQRILWRDSPSQPVNDFRLCTVTYGTACAPYLACKVLQQLSLDYCEEYPEAAHILKEHFYVDDALFGAFDKETAIKLRGDLCQLLQLGGFKLRKWIANYPDLLADIPEEDREIKDSIEIATDPQIKALGLNWSPITDQFSFTISPLNSSTVTKRSVLSDIGRLYDPLGWLSPVIINAKIFMQKLWLAKVDWDETLPDNLSDYWINFKPSLTLLKDISVERWIGKSNESNCGLELHGFCDASMQAYGAVVYLRVVHDFDNVQVSLLAAKTRVSPLQTVSLPRLELCGANLLATLVQYLQQALKVEDVPTYLWTDSTVVLAWLKEHPSKWAVYVANRVAQIHRLVPEAIWRHVQSCDNPADCISRGIRTDQLKEHHLWWSGPPWLKQHSTAWPSTSERPSTVSLQIELRPHATLISQQQPLELNLDLLYRYSSVQRLLRITALCLRFIKNLCRPKEDRMLEQLRMEEINLAWITWIRIIQQHSFPEVNLLSNNKSLPPTSNLLKLQPFLDEEQVLRVGGRLKDSLLNYEEKHPIILPKSSYFTKLIILHAHVITLHGGIQLTLQYIRAKYWIINGRSKVRQIVKDCVICCRYRAKTSTQVMGDLPADRVRPSKPFSIAGVDYAGPFNTTPVRRRGCKSIKSYVAIFVCFVTRAIHIELVMDLTADAFVAAFKRFVSRRGRCSKLYSDNATYFVAANKELSSNIKQLMKDQRISNSLLDMGTDWHFMPPSAPHFGGIWESGVRSFKHHFRRIVGVHILSIEEMLTLLSQVEACLNSRPMHALNYDPTDLFVITPGHFLVGEPLTTVHAPSLLDSPTSHLKRWQLVQQMYENLWQRWYKDYLHHLQLRNKWTQPSQQVLTGNLVLIKDDRLPPSQWLLGRVTEIRPGKDGFTRVAIVRHQNGFFKRPITKLCVLPVQAAYTA